ncbi:MAG: hypothetical protein JTJ30_12470 [Catenibacterium mitsuokai]|nr:hypothetical protein [Catenibacterium mitsuokai]MBN2932779.1 hypothetical protein [Catenibacterium mitsuokai]
MSKYVIHKLPVDISDAKREEYIRYMKTLSNQHSNTYFVSISKYCQYLISDITKSAEPILLFPTIRLTGKEFVKSISREILQISYDKDKNGMFIKKIVIHPMLNGFSMSDELSYYYFQSNNKEQQIKIIDRNMVPLLPHIGKIEHILTTQSRVYEDEIQTLKNKIEEHEKEIYRYMIRNIILSNCDIDKYEVNI